MPSRLRAISHPGQAETLVHFTGRARKEYAPEVYFETPKGILDLICTEERLLAKQLPGYREYMTRVRFRLIPGVW